MSDRDAEARESLKGQVALVTGGGRGIGRAVALALGAAGASVAVIARSGDQLAETVALIERAGGCGLALAADVTSQAAVRRVVQETADRFGPVSILVNNAGTPGPVGPDWEVDADAWWECVEVSVRGAFLCSQAVVPQMIGRGEGRIVHIASTTGTTARPSLTATSVAKTALIRLAEGLAESARGHGISVFAVHPGVVRTELLLSYNLAIPDANFVPPERTGALCVRLASGRYDALSGCFLSIEDDLDDLRQRAGAISEQALYTLRIKV